jgi:diamine N-acetyltransferase
MLIALREITADTVRQITSLSVSPEQQRFVASNATSLAQALFSPEAWYRAIYAGDSPAGFIMLYDESLRASPPPQPQVALWRFMVDTKFQSQGVGSEALKQVIDHVRSKGLFSSLLVSYVPASGCPEEFYLRAGFKHTGKVDGGEIVLELPLESNAP